jgi:glutathione S-transferase
MTALLIQLPYSPWSERARWALEHHHVAYRPFEHVPMIYEPALRVVSAVLTKSGERLLKKATVPMLIDDGKIYPDSVSIAERAEQVGSGTPLIPDGSRAEVLAWADTADRLLDSGRARLMDRLIADDAALRDALPPPLRTLPASVATARLAAKFVKQKYVANGQTAAEHEARMDAELERIERALDGQSFLTGGGFTFADVAVASAIDMVDIRPETALGSASREVWGEPSLAKAHPKAIAYRDRVYAEHR